MKSTIARRVRRRTPSSAEVSFFKKENKQEQPFFGVTTHEAFFQPNAAIQRKCENCKEEEKVQRMADKKEEEKKIQRQPEKKEEEKTIMKKENGAVASNPVTGSYITTPSGGQALPKDVNQFYASRMGENFSHVKIHNDKQAAESAQHINARAYTIGNHIVFNRGQYNTTSTEGKKLLAHELVHIVQNKTKTSVINRAVNYENPAIVETDPVNTVLDNPFLALTTPVINGQRLPNDLNAAGTILFPMFGQPYVERKDNKTMCKIREPQINCGAEVSIIEKPTGKVWQGSAAGSRFANYSQACAGVGTVTVYIKGKSDTDAITVYNKIMANEIEHVNDLKNCSKKHFEPYIIFLSKFYKQVSDDQTKENAECLAAFKAYVGKKDSEMIDAFLLELTSLVKRRDKIGGSHWFKPNVVVDGKDCFHINIKV